MTASITIVNTSNWDGEDFRIARLEGSELLKPGDSVELHPHAEEDSLNINIRKEFAKEPKPIHAPGVQSRQYGGTRRHNGQVFPKVSVTFER